MLWYFDSMLATGGAFKGNAIFDSATGTILCSTTTTTSTATPGTLVPSPPLALVAKAGQRFGGMEIGMGTCARDSWFRSFWLQCPGEVTEPIDERHVTLAFGHAIQSKATITIAPFVRGGGEWWSEVLLDCVGSQHEGALLQEWDALMLWFEEHVGHSAYFISIDPWNASEGFMERPRIVMARCASGLVVGLLGCVVKREETKVNTKNA